MDRRAFLARSVTGVAAVSIAPRVWAQAIPHDTGAVAPAQGTTSNLFDMDQEAAKTVRRPPKAGARASMSADERDALEHDIRCQCGCTLDVYTCRTTDFSCQVSPAMHRDVISLVEGGYSAQEILDAFVGTYGERALMSPKRQGFNWAGYIVPFAVIGIGAAAIVTVLRGMQRRTAAVAGIRREPPAVAATPDELARLDAAIRRDD
jgi:cytochrome c-type biogenesis protein CcmH